jgi:hypothetical protein
MTDQRFSQRNSIMAIGWWRACVAVAACLAAASACGAAERVDVSLDGAWRTVTVPAPSDAPPKEGWGDVQLPGTQWVTPEGGAHAIWYERDIEVPTDLAGRVVLIDLRGAKFQPTVFIDGQKIGGGSDGWTPTTVDISTAVGTGGKHRLSVRCLDRGAFFPEGFVLPKDAKDEVLRGKTLNPVGGYKDLVGFWDRAFLRVLPRTHVDPAELAIVTSTRKGTLSLAGTVSNAMAGLSAKVEVLDGDRVVLTADGVGVEADGKFASTTAFPNPRTWSPEDPHLYTLRLTLTSGGKVVDAYSQRFGFKEFWTEGPDFFLNGVKRRMLASSTWPVQEYVDPAEVRRRLKNVRDCNTIAFRLHTGPWAEAWLDAADELGVLIIDEAAVYTDGSGMYAYKDARFWDNYHKHVEGMIKRDRNRASLAMWSMGNEILFMGANKYDKDLPKKQGDLVRFARTVDPTRPYTFEADHDPDDAYDVIGLHYPHEMPWQRDYPNTADWLGKRVDTEAGGGMLGQQGTSGFLWNRKKPLYIGEFLWVPQGDYSCSTIWYGDEAIRNRSHYHDLGRDLAWRDQSIAYRRSGVSGMTPWTAFTFGIVASPTSPGYLAQKGYYEPLAAFWGTRGLRFFSGNKAELSFDVLNDTAAKRELELKLNVPAGSGLVAQVKHLTLEPAGYASVKMEVSLPEVGAVTDFAVESELSADGKVAQSEKRTLRVVPRKAIEAPKGFSLVVVDPLKRWAGSVDRVAGLDGAVAGEGGKIVLVAEDAEGNAGWDRRGEDVAALRRFVERGGRAVILEQADLEPFALGVRTVGRASTMTFPLSTRHPILAGLRAEDLSYWAPDNYVTSREIERPTSGGGRGVTVSGGADWLKYSGVVEMPLGRGHIVLVQALAGSRRDVEPAAGMLIQNAINYVATLAASDVSPVAVAGDDAHVREVMERLGVVTGPAAAGAKLMVLCGGGEKARGADKACGDVLASGGTVVWHAPTAEAFAAMRGTLGGAGLAVREGSTGISMRERESALLFGVSREDVDSTTKATSWDRKMEFVARAARTWVVPEAAGAASEISATSAKLDKSRLVWSAIVLVAEGDASWVVQRAKAGMYELKVDVADAQGKVPVGKMMVEVNGVETQWIDLPTGGLHEAVFQVWLESGANTILLRPLWEMGEIHLGTMTLSDAPIFPAGVECLTVPAAVTTWRVGPGRVIIDGVNWDKPWGGQSDPARYATALFANLGAAFREPEPPEKFNAIALSEVRLIGQSAGFERGDDMLTFTSNADLEVPMELAADRKVAIKVVGFGGKCAGEGPQIRVLVDGKWVGSVEVGLTDDVVAVTPTVELKAGRHVVRLEYSNQLKAYGEDRNLHVRSVGWVEK